MKNRFLFLLIGITILFITTGCRPEKHYVTSMVNAYYAPIDLKLNSTENNLIVMSFGQGKVVSFATADKYTEAKKEYDELCEKHYDTSYDRKIVSTAGLIYHFAYPSVDFVSLNITSDSDFNSIPAGSSLGDIIRFHSLSVNKYILSGYSEGYNWNESDYDYVILETYLNKNSYVRINKEFKKRNNSPFHPVIKMVSDLEPEEMILLGDGYIFYATFAILEFTEIPVLNKNHNITITLTSDEGVEYTSTINLIFN